jgi:hypothetical protein
MSDTEARFDRLARATQDLRARPGFSARVMQAVQAEPTLGWIESVATNWRAVVAVAALAATTAVGVAVQIDEAETEASAVAFGAVEMQW